MTLTNGATSAVLTPYYTSGDHLGSVDTVVDASGVMQPKESFDTFGKRRDATHWAGAMGGTDLSNARKVTHHGFTHHEQLDNLGLVHANGRVLDPSIGRFLSVDPAYQAPTNSQSVNPYSYVMNNPLSLVDPTGYTSCSDVSTTGGHQAGMCSETDKDGNTAWVGYNVHSNGDVSINTADLAAAAPVIGNMTSTVASAGTLGNGNPIKQADSHPVGDNQSGEQGSNTIAAAKTGGIDSSAAAPPLATQADIDNFGQVKLSSVSGNDPSKETKFFLGSGMDLLGKNQDSCDGQDHCTFDKSEIPLGTNLLGHTHIYDPDNSISGVRSFSQRVADLSRDIPGPGDASPLQWGKLGGVITAGNYHYVFDGTPASPGVHYAGGGKDPVFGAYAAKYWQDMQWIKGKENDQVMQIASDYLRGVPAP